MQTTAGAGHETHMLSCPTAMKLGIKQILQNIWIYVQWIGTKIPIQHPSMSEFQNQRASIHSFEHDPWDLPLQLPFHGGKTFHIPWNPLDEKLSM